MSVLLLLIPVSLGLAALAVGACLVSIRAGQFDDLESPRWRLLFDSVPDSRLDPRPDSRPESHPEHPTRSREPHP